jgi:competence protein ComEC
MVRITAVFSAGILATIQYPDLFSVSDLTVFLTIWAGIYGISVMTMMRTGMYGNASMTMMRTEGLRIVTGISGLLFVFTSGYVALTVRDESREEHSLTRVTEKITAYRVALTGAASRRPTRWRREGVVEAIKTQVGWKEAHGRMLLYWPLESRADTLNHGDQLVVLGTPEKIAGPKNPHEFDYREFLARQQIHHQHLLKEGHWRLLSPSSERGPMYYASCARRWTTATINNLVPGDRERAIVNAFVIGVTDGIDDDLRQAYAAGGAMHALAVSGMHVSILYGVLLLILKPLERRPGGPWTIAITCLVVLWMFAFVTGLPPSVLRAVAMFSFVAIAKPLGRTTSILNTLAASAFFLLVYDPYLILAAGFQLSYLAVLGIVILYRPIYNLWELRWPWSDWLWQITSVSIAAQLATLPVTLYYFHQFPVYFLLANIFVIPASTVILLGGILLLIISPITWLASWLGKGLALSVWLLNEGLFLVSQLPSTVIYPIPMTMVQSICIGGIIVCVYRLLRSRRFRWVWAIAGCVSVFALNDLFAANTDNEFVVYSVPRHSVMEWSRRGNAVVAMDSSLQLHPSLIRYHMEPNLVFHKTGNVAMLDKLEPIEYFLVGGKRFLWVGRSPVNNHHLATDFLIIGNNAARSLETLQRTVTFEHLILDSSNSRFYEDKIIREAARLGIRCYSVSRDGAFVITLPDND